MESLQALTAVDYLFIVVLVTGLAIGWARGFVEVFTGFVVFLVATVVSGRYTAEVVGWLNRTWGAQEWLADVIRRRINLPPEAYKVPAAAVPWSRALEWLRELPIPESYKVTLAQRLSEWSQSAGSQTAAEFITQQMAAGLLSTAVFVLLTVLIGWVLSFLGRLVNDQVKELPLIGTANRMLGGAAYLLQAAILLSVLVALVAPTLSMYGAGSFGKAVEHAYLSPHFLKLFEWLRGVIFGTSGGSFFAQ